MLINIVYTDVDNVELIGALDDEDEDGHSDEH
jgi:hypothetical protein